METGSKVRQLRSVYIEYLEKRIAPATFVVTNLNDAGTGSLRDAVDRANAAPGADTIVFRGAATSGEIALTTGEIEITDSVSIKGPGPAKLSIDAQDLSRIFNIDDGTDAVKRITISGLSMLDGNSGTGNGGGIYCRESLTLVNSVVSGCRAPGPFAYSGGLYIVTDGQAIIRNSKITGNMAGRGAGGMRVAAEAGIQIIDTVISGNTCTGLGGGVYARIHSDGTGNILIDGCTITDNIGAIGGGLNVDNDPRSATGKAGKVIIRDTLISGNFATVQLAPGRPSEGGGLYFEDGAVLIDRCTITNNVATDHGGGLSTDKIDSLTIRASDINNNRVTSTTGAGGGVYIDGDGKTATIQNTVISNNISAGDGGGVFSLNNRLTIQRSTISGNFADSNAGGIYAKQGTLNLNRSILRDNLADGFGGGISMSGTGAERTDVRITNSLFASNRASAGGGIDTRGDGSVTIVSSQFLQNIAVESDGGALYLRSYLGPISITGSLFSQNTASYNGGAMAVRGSTSSVTVTNTVIRDNIAAKDSGGGVAFFTGTLSVTNSSITDNIAGRRGGGVWVGSTASAALTGSLVTGNIAPSGPQIYRTPPGASP